MCWTLQGVSGLFALRMLGKTPALNNPEPYKQFRKWTARWIHVIYLLTVPFSVMSLAAISVQRMLFQFRVNQGENENLTGLYYLYTENLLSSCCDQQSSLIMQTHKHAHTHTHGHTHQKYIYISSVFKEKKEMHLKIK